MFDGAAMFGRLAHHVAGRVLQKNKRCAALIAQLNEATAKALADPAVRDKLVAAGLQANPSSPEKFAAYIKSELGRWQKVATDAKITLD